MVLQYIKGKSSRKLLQEFELLRKRYWGQHLWARGYFAVTVGNVNLEEVQRYIEEQEQYHKKMILEYRSFSIHTFNLLCKRLPNYQLKLVVVDSGLAIQFL